MVMIMLIIVVNFILCSFMYTVHKLLSRLGFTLNLKESSALVSVFPEPHLLTLKLILSGVCSQEIKLMGSYRSYAFL